MLVPAAKKKVHKSKYVTFVQTILLFII